MKARRSDTGPLQRIVPRPHARPTHGTPNGRGRLAQAATLQHAMKTAPPPRVICMLTAVALLPVTLLVWPPPEDNVDPDATRNVSEIIRDKGYPVEEYEVTTRDGFVLALQRIPHGREGDFAQRPQYCSSGRRPPVLILHALLSSSAVWVVNRPDQSLPYVLADAGFDVWLGNVRGNTQSKHVRYTRVDKEFWDFSFQETIQYDLPDTIDLVLNTTGHRKLFFIGHSLGAAVLFGLLSEKPHYNEKILLFSAMAPAVKYQNMKSIIRHIFPSFPLLAAFAGIFGRYDFLQYSGIYKYTSGTLCRRWPIRPICEKIITGISGEPSHAYNATRLPVYLSDPPSGTSFKNMIHMGQVLQTGKFRKFDLGTRRNHIVYGQESPPEYDLQRVSAPVALFWSEADALITAEDVALLRKDVPNVVLDFRVADVRFCHQEFATGVTAKEAVYDHIVDIMRRYSQRDEK
ncbi:lipase member N-like isoform X1 [Haemaphysalis longicornis]